MERKSDNMEARSSIVKWAASNRVLLWTIELEVGYYYVDVAHDVSQARLRFPRVLGYHWTSDVGSKRVLDLWEIHIFQSRAQTYR